MKRALNSIGRHVYLAWRMACPFNSMGKTMGLYEVLIIINLLNPVKCSHSQEFWQPLL